MTTAIIIILILTLLLVVSGFVIYTQIKAREQERIAHELAVAEHRKMIAEKREELDRMRGAINDTKKQNLEAVNSGDPGRDFDASVDILQNLSSRSRDRKGPASGD